MPECYTPALLGDRGGSINEPKDRRISLKKRFTTNFEQKTGNQLTHKALTWVRLKAKI